jgi:hypothetical protein
VITPDQAAMIERAQAAQPADTDQPLLVGQEVSDDGVAGDGEVDTLAPEGNPGHPGAPTAEQREAIDRVAGQSEEAVAEDARADATGETTSQARSGGRRPRK